MVIGLSAYREASIPPSEAKMQGDGNVTTFAGSCWPGVLPDDDIRESTDRPSRPRRAVCRYIQRYTRCGFGAGHSLLAAKRLVGNADMNYASRSRPANTPGAPLAADFARDAWAYWFDACQRAVLFFDVLQQRSERYHEHAAKTAPHVLKFGCELIMDGRKLPRPVNYVL